MSAEIRFTAKSQTTANTFYNYINYNRAGVGQNHGRNHQTGAIKGSVSFYQNILYSYDLPIVRYCRGRGGFIVFNHRAAPRRKGAVSLGTRSPTTSKHISQFIALIEKHNRETPADEVFFWLENHATYNNVLAHRCNQYHILADIYSVQAYKIARETLKKAGLPMDIIKYVIKGYIV